MTNPFMNSNSTNNFTKIDTNEFIFDDEFAQSRFYHFKIYSCKFYHLNSLMQNKNILKFLFYRFSWILFDTYCYKIDHVLFHVR